MIGIDIERVDRFNHWTEEGLKRVFSESEIEYVSEFQNKQEHLCGFYCVKEALVKALDDDGIYFSQIEVLHTESGKPYIHETKYLKQIMQEHNVRKIEISISHSREYATAVVLCL